MYSESLEELFFELNRSLIQEEPGSVFRDQDFYPDMVVVAGGDLNVVETTRVCGELHQCVLVRQFAMSQSPLKQDQWEVIRGYHRDHQQQINTVEFGMIRQMSFFDAYDYARTLHQLTGRDYRLPTPTELEFALGAGSSESYFWMDCDEEGNSRIPESLVRVSRPAYIALSLSDPAPDEEGRIVEFNRGQVDPVSEHILLKYGDISKNSWKECRSVARIGKPVQGKITVQFLIDVADGSNFDLVKTVVGQMKNYLVVRGRSRPWRYAHHHCGTSANVYSDLHWSVVNGAIFDNNSCEE